MSTQSPTIITGSQNPLMNAATDDVVATEQNIIAEIQNLQAYEVSLYAQLEAGISSGTATNEELNDLSNQINEVSTTRDGLYETLYSLFSFYTNNLSDTSVSLQNQTVALEVVENELNSAKKRLAYLEEQKVNKLRLVEIKKYYGEKYEEHTYVMTYIIGMFIWVFILSLLANRGFLPDNVYFLLLLIVIVFYSILIVRTISRIIYRDKMNYQEYDWGTFVTPDPNDKSWVPNLQNPLQFMCAGQECCSPEETYDVSQNVCVPNPGSCAVQYMTTSGTKGGTATTTPAGGVYSSDWFTQGQTAQSNYSQAEVLMGTSYTYTV